MSNSLTMLLARKCIPACASNVHVDQGRETEAAGLLLLGLNIMIEPVMMSLQHAD